MRLLAPMTLVISSKRKSGLHSLALAHLLTLPLLAHAAATHCMPEEDVVFSCPIKNSSKVASICSSKDLLKDEKNGYLVYRFGAPGTVELEYPSVRTNSAKRFSYYHYFRPGTNRSSLTFANGNYQYTIEDEYDEGARPTESIKVSVYGGKQKRSADFACGKPVVAHWNRIDGAVPCDDDLMNSCEDALTP